MLSERIPRMRKECYDLTKRFGRASAIGAIEVVPLGAEQIGRFFRAPSHARLHADEEVQGIAALDRIVDAISACTTPR